MKINPRVAVMREVTTKIVQILSSRNIQVTQRGSKAYVSYNPKTLEPMLVNIPFIPDDANDTLLDAIQGFVDHELGHIFHTDAKELLRAKKLGVGQLHNAIEDTFIERKQKETFKGAGINLENVGRFFLKNFTDKKLKEDPKNAIGYLMIPAIRAWSGQLIFKEYMDDGDKWKTIESVTKRLGSLIHEIPKCESTKDCVDLAVKMHKALGKEPEKSEPPKSEGSKPKPPKKDEKFEESDAPGETGEGKEPSEGESGAGKPKSEPKSKDDEKDADKDEGDGDDTEPAKKEDEKFEEEPSEDEKFSGESSGDEDSTAEDGEMGEVAFGDEDDDDIFSEDEGGETEGDAGGAKTEVAGDGSGEAAMDKDSMLDKLKGMSDYDDAISEAISHDVKDAYKSSGYTIWTKDFDVIEKFDYSEYPESTVTARMERMQVNADQMVGVMQKDLERAIAAKNKSVWRGGLRGGRLNASSLSRLVMNDDRVFRRREVSMSKDVAISLLVDNSGSMGGRRIEIASEAAYALSSVLDRMSITHEVIGFTTVGYMKSKEMERKSSEGETRYARIQPLLMPVYKGFDERLTPDTKRRIAAMAIGHFLRENVDGECVQIAAQRLMAQKEKRKILIVLSDGQPACPGDYYALQRHLKDSVQLVTKSGVETIGIGIETSAVSSYYPKYVVLNDASQLSGEVMQKLRQILLSQ